MKTFSRTSLLLICSLLISTFCFCQTEEELLSKLANAKHDSDKAKIYLGLHDAIFKTDIPKTKVYADKIVECARKCGNLKYELIGYRKLAAWGRRDRNNRVILHYDTLAMITAKKINTPEVLHTMHMQFATDYTDCEQYAPVLYHLNACLAITLPYNNDSARAKVENRLGWYFKTSHQYTKSLPYFEKALLDYKKLNDKKMLAHTQRGYAEALLVIGKTQKVSAVLFEAINYYQKEKSLFNLAQCLAILSRAHLANSNFNQALKNYLELKDLFKEGKYAPEESSATADIASFYLTARNYKKAKEYGLQAQAMMQAIDFTTGLVPLYVFWGQYHTLLGRLDSAEYYFKKADHIAKAESMQDWQTENLRYWAVLKYMQKQKRTGDSLLLKYTERMVNERDPAFIAYDLKSYIRENKITDTNIIKSLSLIYSPQGVQQLKEAFAGKHTGSAISIDSMLISGYNIIPYAADSSKELASYNEILKLEIEYRTRVISDSLKLEKQRTELNKAKLKNRNIMLAATAALLLLVATSLYLQYRSRRRAERDKQRIALLQNEIHHRVKNNLAVINRLVEVAGKNSLEDTPLLALKNRIKSIELLHNHLYSEMADAGNISLQPYFEDLCLAIAATFDSAKNIQIGVQAPVEVDSAIAEKLGLILNELVTNSYKYAFDGKQIGAIQIKAESTDKELCFTVNDNGIGMQAPGSSKSYGMKLIKGLSHELKGRFTFQNTNGTTFELFIPLTTA